MIQMDFLDVLYTWKVEAEQKLNLPRLPSFWQADVTGRCGLFKNKLSNLKNT